MPEKYYLDTAIWIDYFEDRKDKYRPLGDWAHRLLSLIEEAGQTVLTSELVMIELEKYLPAEKVKKYLDTYKKILQQVDSTEKQAYEARAIASKRNLPVQDVLHTILARDNDAILITRDHHFEALRDIVRIMKPEELI
jgi:predicted nucleic acid-binding protein